MGFPGPSGSDKVTLNDGKPKDRLTGGIEDAEPRGALATDHGFSLEDSVN